MELLIGGGAKAAGPAANGAVKESNTQAFVTDVIEPSMAVPVVVEFWSARMPQSKAASAVLEKLTTAAKGALRLVRINIDKSPDLANQLRIETLPTVYAFHGGRPVDGFAGALPESQIKEFLARLLGGQADFGGGVEEALEEAKRLLAEGDPAGAIEVYQHILSQDPNNAAAMGGAIRSLVLAGEIAQARSLLEELPADLAKTPEVAAARSAVDFAELAQQAGPAAELRRQVALDPNAHQARYDLALAYFASGEREAAVDELLELMRRDRTWNEDGARKQLLKLIEAIGYADPLSVSARKRMSTLLFS